MRKLTPSLLPLFFLILIGTAIFYLSRRMNFYFDTISLRSWYWIFSAVLVFMIGGLAGFTNSNTFLGSLIYKMAAIVMGLSLYLLISLILVDLVHLFVKGPAEIFGFGILALTVLVFLYGLVNSFIPRTTHRNIEIKGLESDIRIAHLTDIHIENRAQN
jgi:hypothetical protein